VAAPDEIAGLGHRTGRPRPNTAIDWANQKLTPTEGFVLSRVDGRMSYDEICMVSGLSRDETLRILRDLKQARLILGPGEVAVGASRASAAVSSRSQAAARPAAAGAGSTDEARGEAAEPAASRAGERDRRSPVGPLERLDDGSPVAPGDLVEWPDAPSELKARIVRLHRRLRQLSAWDLLGVGKDADASTVRRAFGAASKELHPDRYFGKNLGSFRAKLGAIFARLSEAMQEVEKARKSAK
jgi:hypothetical protein